VDTFLEGEEPEDNSLDYELSSDDLIAPPGTGPSSHIPGSHSLVIRGARIGKALSRVIAKETPLYLVLHNIESPGFAPNIFQAALATLLANTALEGVRLVKIIASVDHVDATTLWNTHVCSLFSWVSFTLHSVSIKEKTSYLACLFQSWHECNTYRSYSEELSLGNPPMKAIKKRQQDTGSSDAAVNTVLRSLAPRHAEALKLLASLQAPKQPKNYEEQDLRRTEVSEYGVEYQGFRSLCQGKMFVNSDGNLRTMIRELGDHDIVAMSHGIDGKEYVYIPKGSTTLAQILEYVIK